MNLSSVTDRGIGYIVLCLSFVFMKIHGNNLTRNQGNFDRLTSRWRRFFWQVKFLLPKKPNLTCHIINRGEKDGPNGLNESQFALCSMVENFAFTPFLYFLVVPEVSLKEGVLKFIVSCAQDTVLLI